MAFVLALDQSTSATKALLFDDSGNCLDRESREHRQLYPRAGWVEHDAEEIWQNTLAVLRTVALRAAERNRELLCLSVTNQRETIVVFERRTGRPLRPAIVWQCRRGDEICAEHRAAGREDFVHRQTGLCLDAYFSASKLQWLVRQEPGLRTKLESGEALIGTIDTYLVYRLTGGEVFATDGSNASRTLLFDIGRLQWSEDLCSLWQVPSQALPEVRESAARFGETTLEGALPTPLPICGVMGDSQASLFAQRCFEPGMAKATFGTGSSVLLTIGAEPRLSTRGVVTTLAWVHRGRPTYAFEGIIICSAATLTWLRDRLGVISDLSEAQATAAALPDNGGVYLVPAFSGLGLPHWRPDARAAIVGLSSHSERRHVVRAGFESISYQLRDALEAMRGEAGVALKRLHGDGGPTANPWLMQFTADLTRAELAVPTMPDCSALGAAFAGLLGMGRFRTLEELSALPRTEVVYRPSMPPDRADRLVFGWRCAVRQTLCLSESLPA
ncbi:glycerol kinase [Opitutaceae bacterium EW11]|nr:glycerol kinase [Opitutaceae bacterium EW11]